MPAVGRRRGRATKGRLLRTGAGAAEVAQALADAKAEAVSRERQGTLVIGADQVLECDGRLFDKPADLADAAATLRALRGRAHRLVSGVTGAVRRSGATSMRRC